MKLENYNGSLKISPLHANANVFETKNLVSGIILHQGFSAWALSKVEPGNSLLWAVMWQHLWALPTRCWEHSLLPVRTAKKLLMSPVGVDKDNIRLVRNTVIFLQVLMS